MLRRVWPSTDFWFYIGIIFSPSWFISSFANIETLKIGTIFDDLLVSTLVLAWFTGNCLLSKQYFSLRRDPDKDRSFRRYQRSGKIVGYVLLFFGNVGLHFLTEKSIGLMLTFLFLAFNCLCTLLCIQPYTDFGALEFFLTASLNEALGIFGLSSYSCWLVIFTCILMGAGRYWLEPLQYPPAEAAGDIEAQLPLISESAELTKAREEADHLRLAFEGRGRDTEKIISILAHRNATQRALIREEYRTKFSEDLDDRLSEKLSGACKRAVLLWMHEPAARDATIVREALKGNRKTVNSRLEIVIEVICSRTPSQILQMKEAYRPMFRTSLEQDIQDHASGHDIIKLLLEYICTPRAESQEVDEMMVYRDLEALHRYEDGAIVTIKGTFIRIFSERSQPHLAALNSIYGAMHGNSLEEAIKKEASLHYLKGVSSHFYFLYALMTIIQCAENPAKYFTKALFQAIGDPRERQGLRTVDEETLTRIIVSRAETDIQLIKAEFPKNYARPLRDMLHSQTSGPYRSFLISLLDNAT